ncbi:MAG: hypothetical protein ABIH82_06260, partial [Candidatus Woesearchaeota archaeon]
MTELREFTLPQDDFTSYFHNITPESLDRYNRDVHGHSLQSVMHGYLVPLAQAVQKSRYSISGVGSGCRGGPNGEDIHYGWYMKEDGTRVEFNSDTIPDEELIHLRKEKDLAFRVLDGFKKVNWKLKEKLESDSEGKHLAFRVLDCFKFVNWKLK